MATIGEIVIGLKGDSKAWTSAIKVASDNLNSLRATVKATGKDLSNFNTSQLNLLKGWKNEIGTSYKQLDKSLKPVRESLVSSGVAAKLTKGELNQLAIKTTAASIQSKEFGKSLKFASNQLWMMTMGLEQFGRTMTMNFTVPIVAAAGLSLKVFTDWEKGTLSIQRAAEITSESAKKITDSFITISQQVPLTVEELQMAGFAAAQAGVTGEKAITNFAEAAVKLSKVGGDAFKDLPIEKLANDLAKLSIAFGVSGENMEEVNNTASMLLAVAKAVPGGLGEVVEALRRAAGSANAYGVSLETTTALTATLVAAAVPASRAGTELSRVFERMVGKVDLVGEALGYTGKELDTLKDRIQKDMGEVLIELIGRLGATEDLFKKSAIATEIFGEIGKKALLPLANNYELLIDLQARANQELESGALLGAEFDIQANSMAGTLTVLGNAAKSVGKAFADDLAPYVSYFAKIATEGLIKLVKTWRELNPAIKVAILLMGSLLAIVGPLALILNSLFLKPIGGMLTFLMAQSRIITSLGVVSKLSFTSALGMQSFTTAIASAVKGIPALLRGLAILSVRFIAVLAVIGAVAAALYGIGKLLGISIKLPQTPSIKLPEFKKATAPKFTEGGEGELGTEADKDAAKKKEKALTKELRDKRRARNKELKELNRAIKAYEKIRKAEIKALQKLVDEQQDTLDERRELWENELRIEQEKIRAQQETLEAVKKTLKVSRKALKELKDARDDELDVAEGGVDYARMNLEAAQEALKREKLLGHDEFDLSYRIAEARVKAAETALKLALENEIKIKKAWQAQIDAQEDIVDAAEDQVDLQVDALDDLRDALAERKAIVDEEIDLLQDELKIRKDSLDQIKESTQEKLDLMREEKDTIQDAWDDEVDILQERLDAARDQAQAVADMGLPELPDIAGTMGEIDEELKKQLGEMQTGFAEALGFEMGVEEGGFLSQAKGWLDKLIQDYKDAWQGAKELSEIEGKSSGMIFIGAMFAGMTEKVLQFGKDWLRGTFFTIFGEEFEDVEKMAEEEGTTIAGLIWKGIQEWWSSNVAEPFKAWLQEKIVQPLKNLLPNIFRTGEETSEEYKKGIKQGSGGIEQEGTNIVQNFIRGLSQDGGLWNVLSNLRNTIWRNLGSMAGSAWNWGYNLVRSFKNGMESMGQYISSTAEWIGRLIKNVWESLSPPKEGPLSNIDKWGQNLVKTYADSMTKAIPYLQDTLSSINNDIGTGFMGNAAGAVATQPKTSSITKESPIVNKNYYIQPGTMIASPGEIRSFVRMLKEYNDYEEER